MRIWQKMGLMFLLISLIPISIIYFISMSDSKKTLIKTIGTNYQLQSKEKADRIVKIIIERIEEATILAEHDDIKDEVHKANLNYSGRTEEEIAWVDITGIFDTEVIYHKVLKDAKLQSIIDMAW